MPFQSVPGVAEAVVVWTAEGQICTNTFYARALGGTYDQTMIDDLAALVDGWVGSNLLSVFPNDTTYVSTNVRGLENIVDLFATSALSSGVGAQAGAIAPMVTAFCLSRRSGFTGRSARGRVYIPIPLHQIQTNSNIVVTAWADSVVTQLEALRGFMLVAGWVEVIVSRQSGGAVRPFGITFDVTGYDYVNGNIDTQRRRGPGK